VHEVYWVSGGSEVALPSDVFTLRTSGSDKFVDIQSNDLTKAGDFTLRLKVFY